MMRSPLVIIAAVLLATLAAVAATSLRQQSSGNSGGDQLMIQGYTFASNVTAALELSDSIGVLSKESFSGSTDPAAFISKATALLKSTLASFNVGSLGEPMHNLYAAFWKDESHVEHQVLRLLQGTGEFQEVQKSALAIKSGFVELMRYGVVFQAIHHSLATAVSKCEQNDVQRARAEWDMAAALYLGKGVDTRTRSANTGSMLFKLSNELCRTSRTCTESETYGDSINNQVILALFGRGAQLLTATPTETTCDDLLKVKENLSHQMFIPSLQLILKESYRLGTPSASTLPEYDKAERTMVFAHVNAILPKLVACDSKTAWDIYKNFAVNSAERIPQLYLAVADMVAALLPCMKLNCDMLGGYTSYYVAEIETCIDPDSAPPKPIQYSPASGKRTSNNGEESTKFIELDHKNFSEA